MFFVYIVVYGCYYLLNQPIRHIEINGNYLVNDALILKTSKLKEYPSILKYSSKTIEKSIKKIELVDTVKVKKKLGYIVSIEIKENKPLFYYNNEKQVVLSNGNMIKNDNSIYGIPIFTNEVKSDLLKKFISNFSKIDDNVIYEIESISYDPIRNADGEIISSDRFKILMNDGNTIIANSKSVNVVNKYNDIFASLDGKLGTINLDSNKLKNLVFIPYEEENEEIEEQEEDE